MVQENAKEEKTRSRIVLGGGSISRLQQREVFDFLNSAHKIGVSRIDTSPCYGESESLIGVALSGEINFKVTTKICQPRGGKITKSLVIGSVEESLRKLKRQNVECILLHESDIRGITDDGFEEILNLKSRGITKHIGVSSDNEMLAKYAEMGIFDSYLASLSLVDMSNIHTLRKLLADKNNLIMCKRVLANGVWRRDLRYTLLKNYRRLKNEKYFYDQESYAYRHKVLTKSNKRRLSGTDYMRFAFSWHNQTEVLIGTSNTRHLKQVRTIELSDKNSEQELAHFEMNWVNNSSPKWKAHV